MNNTRDRGRKTVVLLTSCLLLLMGWANTVSAGNPAALPPGFSNVSIIAGSVNTNIDRNADGVQATYAPNADAASIGVDNINADLDAGLDVYILTTNAPGNEAGNITVDVPVIKSGVGTSVDISMTANASLAVNADITNNENGNILLTANGNESGNYIGLLINGSVVSTLGTGAISLTGIGGDSGNNNSGIAFAGTNQVTAVNGNITLVGSTPTAGGSTNVGILSGIGVVTTIEASGAGAVTLTGTSGGSEGGGVILHAASTVQATTGDITITGTGTFTACGFGFLGDIISTDSGNIILTGTTDFGPDACISGELASEGNYNSGPSGSFTLNANTVQIDNEAALYGSGVLTIAPRTAGTTIGIGGGAGTLNLTDNELLQLLDGFSSVIIGRSDAGDISVDTAVFFDDVTLITAGTIADVGDVAEDITSTNNTVTFDGMVAPGSSPGTFWVNADAAFADNSTFVVELTNGTLVGPHDLLRVNGDVTIGNSVALTLDTATYGPHAAGTITIIDNGVGAVAGTFDGLASGAQTNPGNTPNFLIGYDGGDGNDVILTSAGPSAISFSQGATAASSMPVLTLIAVGLLLLFSGGVIVQRKHN